MWFCKSNYHLDGKEIYIESYDIVKDGDLKIIIDKGLPCKNKSYRNGDLFVKFKVEYPLILTDSTKEKIYELLTNKKFNSSKIHKIPKDHMAATMRDISDYTTADNYYEDDDENGDGGCAQQ